MDYTTYSEKLTYLKWLVEKGNTGSPKNIGLKLDVSERTVRRMINTLRDQGIKIQFVKAMNSYVLDLEG